ncbi:MAG: NAD(P)-binding protein [Actinomycetota bacterium]
MTNIETDYLIVGAGAAGMAFADALIAESDCDVVLVDRRDAPGGHWNDAYPFVRIHQTSANYGVNSRVLGTESIGPDGFYDRSTGPEICAYFRQVLDQTLLPSGRVRFLPVSEYVGDWSDSHTFVSRLTGQTTEVAVRRRLVDSTYLEVSVPATHEPSFTVDDEARLIPVGDLVCIDEPPAGYTIIGAGKTAMDAGNWLLEHGVDPGRIRWIRPRDAWVFDRASFQPLDLIVQTIEAFADAFEALARADDIDDLWHRLEDCGELCRLDAAVEPTMFRGAILSQDEIAASRQIERVVRMGRVRHIGTDRIVLEEGEVPTSRDQLHVDCTARGFRTAPPRPIFEPGRITLQSLIGGFTTYNAALVGYVESTSRDDHAKNVLCPPLPQPNEPIDWIKTMCAGMNTFSAHSAEPDVGRWVSTSRLSLTRGMAEHMDDPRMQPAMARWLSSVEPGIANADRLLADKPVVRR